MSATAFCLQVFLVEQDCWRLDSHYRFNSRWLSAAFKRAIRARYEDEVFRFRLLVAL